MPFNVSLKPGTEYVLALHFVDYIAHMPPLQLKSEDMRLSNLIVLTPPGYTSSFLKSKIQQTTYQTIWVSVFSIISLLFWLLYFQNPKEKGLLPIALYPTILTATFLCVWMIDYIGNSYVAFIILNYTINLFQGLSFVVIPLILVNIFKRKVTRALKVLLITILLLTVLSGFVSRDIADVLYISMLLILISVSIYYMVSSWIGIIAGV